jgi:hypothetical protein
MRMADVSGLIFGLIVAAVGLSILVDLRGFGSRAIRLSLYAGAPPWKSNARPDPGRVERHRIMFGAGVTVVGLLAVAASAAGLA